MKKQLDYKVVRDVNNSDLGPDVFLSMNAVLAKIASLSDENARLRKEHNADYTSVILAEGVIPEKFISFYTWYNELGFFKKLMYAFLFIFNINKFLDRVSVNKAK